MAQELILVIDFGGQYNQLIARRVRDISVYCEVKPYDITAEEIKQLNPKGLIFTGGPATVTDADAPRIDTAVFNLDIPILAICYGAQLTADSLGGKVEKAPEREYGKKALQILDKKHPILVGHPKETHCWMSHTYQVTQLPPNFTILASTDHCKNTVFANDQKKIYGVQYHPEVVHTPEGQKLIHNFVYQICGCIGTWKVKNFVNESVESIKKQVGDRKVLCALSGGVDSSVAAALVHKAIGDKLTCIFVDNGLLRKNEAQMVEEVFRNQFKLNLICVDARKKFLDNLSGVTDPEQKRKIIGETFIRVFEEEAIKLKDTELLVQGTIYPDIIESGTKHAAVIKSHHNVGGLPENMAFTELVEPLRLLFKDEVRGLGKELGLPLQVVNRQPFPGPGLAIRIIGEITEEKLNIVREADVIYLEEIQKAGLQSYIWQYFAVLTGVRTVGVMGDERTYGYVIALRAVSSTDGMTADWAKIPFETLEKISTRIVNEVQGVNRIVYDITSKPPSTIEWE